MEWNQIPAEWKPKCDIRIRKQKTYGNEKSKNMSHGDLTSYHNDRV